jgi:hypothetical protein
MKNIFSTLSRLSERRVFSNFLILAVAVFYLLNLRNGHDWGSDFSMYIHHAQNLVSGVPYSETGYIYNPDTADYGPQAYPPVFPLILTPFVYFFGINLLVLKIPGILCFITFLFYLNNQILDPDLSEPYRILLVGLIGFSRVFLFQSESILSDIPFLLFVTIALYRIDLTFKFAGQKETTWKSGLLTGLCVYLACGVRTIGIILFPIVLLMYLLNRKNNGRSFLTILISSGLLITLQKILIPGTGSYFDQLPRSLPELLVILNLLLNNYLSLFLQLVPVQHELFQKFTFLGLFLFFIAGVYFRIKKGASSFDLFFIAYFIALLFWPSYQGYRFLLPIIPVYFLFIVEGLSVILTRLNRSVSFINAILIILAGLISWSYISSYQGVFPRPVSAMEQTSTQELFSYVKKETAPDDVIVFFKPRVLALYTGRSSVAIAAPGKEIDPLDRMRQFGVDWIIVRKDNEAEYQPGQIEMIAHHPERFLLVTEIGDFSIYKFR